MPEKLTYKGPDEHGLVVVTSTSSLKGTEVATVGGSLEGTTLMVESINIPTGHKPGTGLRMVKALVKKVHAEKAWVEGPDTPKLGTTKVPKTVKSKSGSPEKKKRKRKVSNIKKDIALELQSIKQYNRHIKSLKDSSSIKGYLESILSDEEEHYEKLVQIAKSKKG